MIDFKSQQYRWTKGSVQVLKKLFVPICFAPISLRAKCEAFAHLTSSFCYLLGVIVALLLAPVAVWRSQTGLFWGPWFELLVFIFTFGSLTSFYVSGQSLAGRKLRFWPQSADEETFSFWDVCSAILLGVGISLTCASAVLSGMGSKVGEFVRTPKKGTVEGVHEEGLQANSNWASVAKKFFLGKGYRRELIMCVYLWIALVYTLSTYRLLSAPFLVLMLFAYMLMVARVTREQIS